MSSPILVLLLVILAGIAVVTLAIVLTFQSRRARPAGPRKTATPAGWLGSDSGMSFDGGSADCSADGGGGGGCD